MRLFLTYRERELEQKGAKVRKRELGSMEEEEGLTCRHGYQEHEGSWPGPGSGLALKPVFP